MINLDKNWPGLGLDRQKFLIAVIRDLFLTFFLLFVLFSVLEIFKPRIILNYLNLDVFFLIMIFLGVITVLYYQVESVQVKSLNYLDYLFVALSAILIGILCLYLTRAIGWLSILVGLAGAIITYFFVVLIYKGE